MQNNQQQSYPPTPTPNTQIFPLHRSMQIDRKYQSQTYNQLLEEVDQHNNKFMMKYTRTAGEMLDGKCLDDVRVDNQLLRDYTNAVYRQYKLDNHFDHNVQNTSSKKILNSQKKQIKLVKKHNLSTSIPPNINYPYSYPYPYSISSKQANTATQNAITPTKPPNLKKSTLKSTAHSHMRSKTGLTQVKSINVVNQFVIQSQGKKYQPARSQNNQVYVSEFDDGVLQAQSKISNQQTNKKAINNQQYAKNYSNQLKKSSLDKKQQSTTFCPICEQELSKSNIHLHENKCPQLPKLYNLQKSSLSEYVSWKIDEHLQTIRTILTNLQIKKSVIMNNHHLEQSQEKQQGDIKDINQQIDINQISYPQFAQKKKEYIDGIVQQCGEEIKKCIWFQEIKENLGQNSQKTQEMKFQ